MKRYSNELVIAQTVFPSSLLARSPDSTLEGRGVVIYMIGRLR
jgi:hypothetical protein